MKTVEATTADQAANVAAPGAPVAPETAASKKGASRKKGATKPKGSAKTAAPKKAAKAPKAPQPARVKKVGSEERSNKKADVIAMMKRAKGATLAEIMESTGWLKHTVRGFVSILGSKGGLKIDSSKDAGGERMYRIAK